MRPLCTYSNGKKVEQRKDKLAGHTAKHHGGEPEWWQLSYNPNIAKPKIVPEKGKKRLKQPKLSFPSKRPASGEDKPSKKAKIESNSNVILSNMETKSKKKINEYFDEVTIMITIFKES